MGRATAVVAGVGADRGRGPAFRDDLHAQVATPARIARVAERIIAGGGSAEAVPVDVTFDGDVVRLFDRAIARGDDSDSATSWCPTLATTGASISRHPRCTPKRRQRRRGAPGD